MSDVTLILPVFIYLIRIYTEVPFALSTRPIGLYLF